jgi:hypothetical protein
VFAAIFRIYFLCLWFLVAAIIGFIGVWFSLATLYRTRVPFNGAKWRMQNGQMRWLMNYNNVVPWEFHAAFFIDGRYHDLRRSASSRRPGNRRLCARDRLGFGNCSIKK